MRRYIALGIHLWCRADVLRLIDNPGKPGAGIGGVCERVARPEL